MDVRFYWIKIKDTFFTSDTVDFLMSQKNGSNYVVLYQMLCLKAVNNEGQLARKIGEVLIPYDTEKIQRDCKWFDIDTVRVALELYKKLGLVYEEKGKMLVISNFQNMVGGETKWAEYKRAERIEQKSDKIIGQIIGQCPKIELDNVQQEKEIDKDKEYKERIYKRESNILYGEYKWIALKESQYNKLVEEYGKEKIDLTIKLLDEYLQGNGNKNKYKDFNLVIRKAIRDKWFERGKSEVLGGEENPNRVIRNISDIDISKEEM